MRLSFIVLFMLTSWCSYAQMPTLKVGEEKNNPVILEQIDIDVAITGNIATTTMLLSFKNNGSRVLEGELTFPMPEGVTVSKYALDINGKMREAVPVSKARATEVFESIQHRNIDPGILEKVEGNNFRTRIFPLPVGGIRTVMIGYEQELTTNKHHDLQYYLPFNYTQAIPRFSLKASIWGTKEKPVLLKQPDGSFTFSGYDNVFTAKMEKQNYQPVQPLLINLPKKTNTYESILQRNTDGRAYFLINDFPATESRARQWGNTIGLLWDVSLSGAERDHQKEIELLDQIIQQKQNLTIALGLLNNRLSYGGNYKIVNGQWSELRKKLEQLTYDGATDYSVLKLPVFIDQVLFAALDEILFFTDGMSSFGDAEIHINRPIHTVTTNPVADYSVLKNISQKTGGQFINLGNQSADQAFDALGQEYMQFLGVEGPGVSEVYPNIKIPVIQSISVAGLITDPGNEITLLYGWGNKITLRKKIKAGVVAKDISVHKIWAQKKIAAMDIYYDKYKEELNVIGEQFGIVTRNTSLMVLENIDDYIRYDITPPAELLAEFNQLKKENRIAQEQRVNDLLERAATTVADLKEWWRTDFTSISKKNKYPIPSIMADSAPSTVDAVGTPPPPPPRVEVPAFTSPNVVRDEEVKEAPAISNVQRNAEMTIAAIKNTSIERELQGGMPGVTTGQTKAIDGTPEIEIPEFKTDKDYIKKLNAVHKTQAYPTYLALRKEYETTPSFYFDVADWFYNQKKADTAFMILSNITELSIENASLYKMMAYKLKQLGNNAKQLWTAKKILDWRPMDPQSTRDYALALIDNGRYQEALDALYSILTNSYSAEAASRDEGIEEVIVMEINKLVSQQRSRLNLSKIDKRIIANLPVDIRVVLNWNKPDTDIDLWVTDPNGEKCYYSYNRTSNGGRISNDFTDGFGPEQFLLKKAAKGEYKIETNFFNEDRFTITGPTTLMAEIYLYYASGKETRKIVTLQSGENGKEADGMLVGTFKF
ncbi:VIT domain-containing protein [Niabella sp. CJ426]|uniref:VIT domain-containing protein n=1 Tax=Niabella sp. CJ426 TaxID=3393740 RepID=UPI003CFE11A2